MKLGFPLVGALRLWFFFMLVHGSVAEDFPQYRWAVPCPSVPSLTGYVSLADLNTEMRRHSSELSPPLNKIPSQEFRYHLCPQSTFNASVPLFLPPALLHYSPVIQCGQRGLSAETCILRGGVNHVLLMDATEGDDNGHTNTGSANVESGTQRHSIVFQGIVFQESSDISIAAFSNRTHAQFIDCHWKNIQGRAAIMMANAKPLTWPQVPQPTFVLENQNNIFSSRRRRELTSTRTTTTTTTTETTTTTATSATTSSNKVTMQVSCLECSFQDSGNDDFILVDSYMRGALLILLDSKIQSITGAMVINMLHGSLQLVDTSISQCSTSIATVRGQSQSTLDIYNSTFSHNQPAMATIAIVKKSKLQMNATQLWQDGTTSTTTMVAPLVVVESSHVTLADSCWILAHSNTNPAAVVDSTSSIQLDRTSISLVSSMETNQQDENSTATTSNANNGCSAKIWNLATTLACLDTNSCQGACESIPEQDQCTIPTNIPTWEQVIGQPSTTSSHSSGGPTIVVGWMLLLWTSSILVLGSHLL